MPPTRRSRSSLGPAEKGAQSKLSFSNSKVHKPTSIKDGKDSSLSKSAVVKALDLGHISSAPAVQAQAKAELAKPAVEKTVEELQAEKITDAQIKQYWREREAERRAPRVHQEGLAVEEKILRLFDMSSQFGVWYSPSTTSPNKRENKVYIYIWMNYLVLVENES